MLTSVVIPCFNEQETIHIFYKELLREISKIDSDFEFIFVDDGSNDGSLFEIKKLKEIDSRVRYISFSRNFGKDLAVFAGLEESTGDCVVVIDVDLQDSISLLPKFYDAVTKEGYDSATAIRTSKKTEISIRAMFTRFFYKINRFFFKFNLVDGIRDYRLMNRKFVNELLKFKEKNRFIKGLYQWVGLKTKYFEYDYIPRISGQTKWDFSSLFIYGVGFMLSFSETPLYITIFLGVILFLISIFLLIAIIVKTLILNQIVTSFVFLLWVILFVGGLQLSCLGMLGLYIGMIYSEVKDRPLYVIKEKS